MNGPAHPLLVGIEPLSAIGSSPMARGQIENQVGNVREWLFTPTPRFADFAALNAWLATRCPLPGRACAHA